MWFLLYLFDYLQGLNGASFQFFLHYLASVLLFFDLFLLISFWGKLIFFLILCVHLRAFMIENESYCIIVLQNLNSMRMIYLEKLEDSPGKTWNIPGKSKSKFGGHSGLLSKS